MTDSAPSPSFAQLLRRYRHVAALTQEQLAERAGLSARAVSDLERGENRMPRRDTLELLADALELSVDERAILDGTIRRTRDDAHPAERAVADTTPRPSDAAIDTLPAQPTAFIGREHEIEVVRGRLLDVETRVLTLLGPGGVGKTRLAVQVAGEVAGDFTNGVTFVSLAPVSDPELVLSTIAHAVGVAEVVGQPLGETLSAAFRDKHMLLVLDNFEQILPAAIAVAALLAAAPGVTALVTTRAPLHVRGERIHAVPGLAVPTPPLPPLAALSQYEAVRLFIARAQDVQPNFAVTNETAPAVADICARLDGLPLAIELAAARIRLLSPEMLLTRLSHRLKVVTGGAQDLPARQQTLRATIDWSYSLLTPAEQTLLARLAVFAGGRTLEAVEAVCDSDGDLAVDVLDGLESLLNKSLLRVEQGSTGSEARYVMLETIHEYAAEQLVLRGEADTLRRAHAAYYLTLAERGAREVVGPNQGAWLERVGQEYGNFRVALQWAREVADADVIIRMAGSLWRFWHLHGHANEGWGWLEWAATGAERAGVDDGNVARALRGAGSLAWLRGHHRQALAWLADSVALYEGVDDKDGVSGASCELAIVCIEVGEYERGVALLDQALRFDRELGDRRGEGVTLSLLAGAAAVHGAYDAAIAQYKDSISLLRKGGDTANVGTNLANLACVMVLNNDLIGADPVCREAFSINRHMGFSANIATCVEVTAGILARTEQPHSAARLLAAMETQRDKLGMGRAAFEQIMFEQQTAIVRSLLDAEVYESACDEGRALSFNDAVADASSAFAPPIPL